MRYLVLIISLLFHLALYLALKQAGNIHYKEASLIEVIEDIAKARNDSKQIILYAEAPDIDVTSQEEAKLLSKTQQRVKKQSVAAKIGKTKNRSPRPKVKIQKKEQAKSRDQLSRLTKPEPIDLNRIGGLFEDSGASTIGQKVFDKIPIGNFTALNTDEYSFYSFTERVDDRIRSRWIRGIEDSLLYLKNRGLLDRLDAGDNTTVVEILLNKQGHFKGATLYKSSGQKSWDEAAIRAFKDGAPFINPPHEIVDEDGIIRLRYAFNVIWDPRYAKRIR